MSLDLMQYSSSTNNPTAFRGNKTKAPSQNKCVLHGNTTEAKSNNCHSKHLPLQPQNQMARQKVM